MKTPYPAVNLIISNSKLSINLSYLRSASKRIHNLSIKEGRPCFLYWPLRKTGWIEFTLQPTYLMRSDLCKIKNIISNIGQTTKKLAPSRIGRVKLVLERFATEARRFEPRSSESFVEWTSRRWHREPQRNAREISFRWLDNVIVRFCDWMFSECVIGWLFFLFFLKMDA